MTAGAYADVPLFLFHLLEFMGVDFELDVDEVNERWSELASSDLWSQMIIKETAPAVELIDAAPPTGQYAVDALRRAGVRAGPPWTGTSCRTSSECFFLRVYGVGRLPVEGRRPRRAGHQGPAADRGPLGQRAERPDHPGQAPDRLDPGALRRHADAEAVEGPTRRRR